MVLDPLGALGLAANIFQVLDFGWKIVGSSIAISANGASSETLNLETVFSKLKTLSSGLSSSLSRKHAREEEGLQDLAAQCQLVTEDLLNILQLLKLPDDGRNRTWESIRVACREFRLGDRVASLTNQLSELQRQLSLHLLVLLRKTQSDVLNEVERLRIECRQYDVNRAFQLEQMYKDLQQKFRIVQSATELSNSSVQPVCPSTQSVASPELGKMSIQFHRLLRSLEDFVVQEKTVSAETRILRSLSFAGMHQRCQDIPVAHPKTFHWIFNSAGDNANDAPQLVHWLRTGSGIFWVTGKAGSGKSTLMKHIVNHSTTASELQQWAQPGHLVTANYFFWNAGTRFQKTQVGLLRALLFQVFLSCRGLINQLDTFNSEERTDSPVWSRNELLDTVNLITSQSDIPAKFCFFIDGLDEYGGEDYGGLIAILKTFSRHPSIKICVSSRPWNEFQDAFGGEDHSLIRLEQLTMKDIAEYVETTFEDNTIYQFVRSQDERYPQLVNEIVRRADGVFLWVYLVVQSLLRGLTNEDRISDLERRLHALPPTLEEFFQHILDSVEDVYKPETANTLFTAIEADKPLGLMVWSFLDEDPDFALSVEPGTMTTSEIESRYLQMRKRINGRCKGILEVRTIRATPLQRDFDQYQVDFLHRSARDFVRKSTTLHKLLGAPADKAVENNIRLMRAFLALLKLGPVAKDHSNHYDWISLIVKEIIYYAQKTETTWSNEQAQILDMTESVVHCVSSGEHWSESGGKINHVRDTVAAGLVHYTRMRLERDAFIMKSGSYSFLQCALNPPARWPGGQKYYINIDMVKLLLDNKADPNCGSNGATVWQDFVRAVYRDTLQVASPNDTILLLELLIQHGADVHICCVSRSPSGGSIIQLSAAQVIREKLRPDTADLLLQKAPSTVLPPSEHGRPIRKRFSFSFSDLFRRRSV